jgi:hypothetical protein
VYEVCHTYGPHVERIILIHTVTSVQKNVIKSSAFIISLERDLRKSQGKDKALYLETN